MAGGDKGKQKTRTQKKDKPIPDSVDVDADVNPSDLSLDLEELVPRAVEHLLKTSTTGKFLGDHHQSQDGVDGGEDCQTGLTNFRLAVSTKTEIRRS